MITKTNRRSIAVLLAFLVFLLGPGLIHAQEASPTPTPDSEELKALKERNAILEQKAKAASLEKDIAEAEKKETDARFPKPTSSPLEGKTTISDGAIIESQMISYLSLANASNGLIDQLKKIKLTIKNLAIYNERDVNSFLSYKVTLNQIQLMQDEYDAILKKPQGDAAAFVPAIGIATSILGSFVDLTALLRTNVDIKGQTFDIEESNFVAEVFRGARAEDGLRYDTDKIPNLYYPAVFPPNIDIKKKSELLTQLQKLSLTRSLSAGLISALEDNEKKIGEAEAKIKKLNAALEEISARKKEVTKEIDRLNRVYGPKPPPEIRERLEKLADELKDLGKTETETNTALGTAKTNLQTLKDARVTLQKKLTDQLQDPSSLDDAVTRLKSLNDQFAKFVEALVKVNESSGTNSLTTLIRAESLLDAMTGENSYWLQLKVVKAGGNNRIKTNLLVDVFRGGNRISHSGGAIVQYNLFDNKGNSVASDVLTNYSGYIKAEKIRKLPNPEKVGDGKD